MSSSAGLAVRSVSKSFGAVAALRQVSFEVAPGEVHALVGENGAGKSTLMNILSGVLQPDEGTIIVNGHEGAIRSPRAAQASGIGTVFQELSLVGSLSVAENVFAGRVPALAGLVRWRELRGEVRRLLRVLDLDIDPATRVDSLPLGTRQLIEIAKALSLEASILLLDEPSSALSQNEKRVLFSVIRRLADEGIVIVFISHHLEEVFELSRRITVLRDGRSVASFATGKATADAVVRAMVGRDIAGSPRRATASLGSPLLECRGLTAPGRFLDIDLAVRAGEIVALAGLMGSGRSDLAQALGGVRPADRGSIRVDGRETALPHLRAAMRDGIAYVPGDRMSEGVFPEFDVASNIAVTALRKVSCAGLVSRRRMETIARRQIEALQIKTRGPRELVRRLSGGNQQKIMLAKWIETHPRILIVDEPTKGIDVGAKFEIHALIKDLAARGVAILLVSSDFPEVLALADRIVVMRRGRIVGEVDAARADEEAVMALASGAHDHREKGA